MMRTVVISYIVFLVMSKVLEKYTTKAKDGDHDGADDIDGLEGISSFARHVGTKVGSGLGGVVGGFLVGLRDSVHSELRKGGGDDGA